METSTTKTESTVEISQHINSTREKLIDVLNKYAVPDPKIVFTKPKGGRNLEFVGHADITKILVQVDPFWYFEPIKFDDNGLPAYRVENGMAHMAGRLCLLGVERLAIGSVEHNKADLFKELYSDAIKNGAMRFGIALNLWTKSEWPDVDNHPAPAKQTVKPAAKPQPASYPASTPEDAEAPLTQEQIEAFNKACVNAFINPMTVYKNAGVKFGFGKQKDLEKLRESFKKLAEEKKEEKE